MLSMEWSYFIESVIYVCACCASTVYGCGLLIRAATNKRFKTFLFPAIYSEIEYLEKQQISTQTTGYCLNSQKCISSVM